MHPIVLCSLAFLAIAWLMSALGAVKALAATVIIVVLLGLATLRG